MPLNKSNGHMYDWLSHTWNPLGGKCLHQCGYCSCNKLMRYPGIQKKYSGESRIMEHEMKTNLGTDNFIFVCAQSDLFAENVSSDIVLRILDKCKEHDNQYLFQSKNTKRIAVFQCMMPKNSVVCTTIETNRVYPAMEDCPSPYDRVLGMVRIDFPRYITIEPVMDYDTDDLVDMIKVCCPEQVNIGANTWNKAVLPEPSKEKLKSLIRKLSRFTKVKEKSNLKRLL